MSSARRSSEFSAPFLSRGFFYLNSKIGNRNRKLSGLPRRSLGATSAVIQRATPAFVLLRRGSLRFALRFKRRLAEGVRFELTRPFGLPVFKTGAINHSATPPKNRGREKCAIAVALSKDCNGALRVSEELMRRSAAFGKATARPVDRRYRRI